MAQQPFGGPASDVAAAGRASRPRRIRWPVIVIVALVAIGLGVGGGVFVTSAVDSARRASTPSEVVHAYLTALATGDADTALALAADQPADRTLMTDEVLRSVNELAPLREIEVPPASGDRVSASYLLGEQRVNAEFRLVDTPQGPRLRQSWGLLRLHRSSGGALPTIVHGVPVTAEETPVFPGVYPVTTGRTMIDWGPEAAATVPRPESYGTQTARLSPTLTATAVDLFRAETRQYLDDCLATTILKPEGCPFETSASGSPEPGSVTWSVDEDPMELFDPRIDYDDVTLGVARMSFSVQVSWRADGESRNTTTWAAGTATLDLSDDDNPVFAWRD